MIGFCKDCEEISRQTSGRVVWCKTCLAMRDAYVQTCSTGAVDETRTYEEAMRDKKQNAFFVSVCGYCGSVGGTRVEGGKMVCEKCAYRNASVSVDKPLGDRCGKCNRIHAREINGNILCYNCFAESRAEQTKVDDPQCESCGGVGALLGKDGYLCNGCRYGMDGVVSDTLAERAKTYPPFALEGNRVGRLCDLLEEVNVAGKRSWTPAEREAMRRVAMKLVREAYAPHANKDSVIDLCGYLRLYSELG